jgi:hypothetical protein
MKKLSLIVLGLLTAISLVACSLIPGSQPTPLVVTQVVGGAGSTGTRRPTPAHRSPASYPDAPGSPHPIPVETTAAWGFWCDAASCC